MEEKSSKINIIPAVETAVESEEDKLHKIKRHSLAEKELPPVIYPRWKADE